jgi:phenylalanyl-tRNA synthetase beta chain
MRVPLSWLREYVDLPADVTGRELAARLIEAGLEVETVEDTAAGLSGNIVVGEVLEVEELTGFKKPIRYCALDVGGANGSGDPQHVICGAVNFAVGDRVVVVLPGSTLPGGFEVGSRTTYGRLSHGMICSAAELGMWDDHSGILVLGPQAPDPGTDAVELLGLHDEVLDIAVTPDRGYALSMRGVARDAAVLYGVGFRDPAMLDAPAGAGDAYPADADPKVCSRYVLRQVSGFDPDAQRFLYEVNERFGAPRQSGLAIRNPFQVQISGRINRTADRATVLMVAGPDALAAWVSWWWNRRPVRPTPG